MIWRFEAIGTVWHIETYELTETIKASILDYIEQFDEHYSRFRGDGLIARLAEHPGAYTLPDDAKPMMDLYEQLYKLTDGKMTPLIGQTMEQAGYDMQYSFESKIMTPTPKWNEVMTYSFPKLVTTRAIVLDYGALGKGYLVDCIREILQNTDVQSAVINAGGDIYALGATTCLLEDPGDIHRILGEVKIENEGLCGSAGNRRQWGKFQHIIDPDLHLSPRHIKAVWVRAASAMLADGLTTALYFADPEKLLQHFKFEYVIIEADTLTASPGFQAKWYT